MAVKKRGQWLILYNSKIEKIISGLVKIKNVKGLNLITSNLDRIDNTALIPFPHTINPAYYDINRTVTQDKINRKLFGRNTRIDVLKINYGVTNDDVAIFATDEYWDRILYTKNGSDQIKSIGKTGVNLNDWHIYGIAAQMNVVGSNYFYVVSTAFSNRITKLRYDPASNNVQFIANYSVPGAISLSDISIEQSNGTRLWVVSPDKGISLLSTSGALLATYTQFYYNGQYYPIQNIYRLEVSNSSPSIGFIDKGGRRLVICKVNEYANNRLEAFNVVEFPTSSLRLGDVGINFDSEFYFSQGNIIHKFNMFGEYICSFENSSWFNSVGAISNFAVDRPELAAIELYITNTWSDNYGIRRYLLGSDAMDLSFQQLGYNSLQFNYRITGDSYVKVDILQNNNVIKTFKEVNWEFSGFYTIVENYNELSPGNYQMKVSYKHWQDQNYGDFQQGLRTKSINFTVTAQPHYPPVLSSITQSPLPIYKGSSGYIYSHLSQGDSPLTYSWSAKYLPSGSYITPLGDKCRLTYPSTKFATSNSLKGIEAPVAEITCLVTNTYGNSTLSFTPSFSSSGGGIGCPTLAFENNGVIENENPILSKSVIPNSDVTDYYLIQKNITLQDNKVKFIIHEPEEEHTYLDQLQLIEVKIASNEYVGVTEKGDIINYKLSKVQNIFSSKNANNIIDKLSLFDNKIVHFFAGDSLEINSKKIFLQQGPANIYLVLGGSKAPIKIQNAAEIIPSNGDGSLNTAESSSIYLRPNKSVTAFKLDANYNNGFIIKFTQDIDINLISIVKNERTAKINYLNFVEAINSEKINVNNLVTDIDQKYSEILPGGRISFTFENKNNSIGKSAYILKAVGRYEISNNNFVKSIVQTTTERVANIQSATKLIGNYPNPFNPTTQISYQLQKATFVTIKIYDILGKEIKTLVNKYVDTGLHQVLFDANNLSSGVYMLTMQTNEKYEIKKMLLMR